MSDNQETRVEAAAPEPGVAPLYERPECLRCGLKWNARNPHKRPSSCPRCGSALWDQPPKRKTARRPDDPPNPNWSYRLKPIKKKCPTCGRVMRRLTVKERQELDEKNRQQERKESVEVVREAERIAYEHPARPHAVTPHRGMTPPPGLRGPTPPPARPTHAETPEVQATRSLSDELKETT